MAPSRTASICKYSYLLPFFLQEIARPSATSGTKRKRATPPEQPQTLQDHHHHHHLQKPKPEPEQNPSTCTSTNQLQSNLPPPPTPPSASISSINSDSRVRSTRPVAALPFSFSFFFLSFFLLENCQLWSFFWSPILALWINYCLFCRLVARQPVARRRPPSPSVAHLGSLNSRRQPYLPPSSYPSPAAATRTLSVATCRDATPRKLKLLKRALTGNALAGSANLLLS